MIKDVIINQKVLGLRIRRKRRSHLMVKTGHVHNMLPCWVHVRIKVYAMQDGCRYRSYSEMDLNPRVDTNVD